MPYKLYTDKNENFECEINVKNASLKGSIVRLVVESDEHDINLVFNGTIEKNKCIVPIKRLKGILDENTTGKMHLEIIVEDTYFKPWESRFLVEEHTSVKVKVNEQKQSSNKPIVEVKVHPLNDNLISNSNTIPITKIKKKNTKLHIPLKEISNLCGIFGINKKNVKTKKKDLSQILKEYFIENPEYRNNLNDILMEIPFFLK